MAADMTRRDITVLSGMAIFGLVLMLAPLYPVSELTLEIIVELLALAGAVALAAAVVKAGRRWSGELRRSIVLIGSGSGVLVLSQIVEVGEEFAFLPPVFQHVSEVLSIIAMLLAAYGFYVLAHGPWFSGR